MSGPHERGRGEQTQPVTPSPESLHARYNGLTDADLLAEAAHTADLTPEAEDALQRELQRRSLDAPAPSTEDEEPLLNPERWVTVDRFRDLSTAIVARGALEAAGIPCFLRDENTIRLDWQISNFIGGMRLQVHEDDREAAATILNGLERNSGQDEADGMLAGDRCPFCGSTAIHRKEESFGLRTAMLWIFTLPLPRGRRYWQCDTCGRRFTEAELDRSESR